MQRPQDDPWTLNANSGDGTEIGAVELKVPKASIGDMSLTAGSEGTTDATFTVKLSESEVSAKTLGVHYVTQNDEATSPADYSSASGTLEFASPISDATATEATSGSANAAFTVSLSAPSGKAVSVEYSTSDGTATVASGDYSETSGTLYFSPGTTSKSVSVPVNSDVISEPNENFFLSLSGAENATVAGEKGEGTIVDSPPPANGAPTASNDSFSTAQDNPLRVAAPGPLSNDSDPDGDALTAAEVSDPAHGNRHEPGQRSYWRCSWV